MRRFQSVFAIALIVAGCANEEFQTMESGVSIAPAQEGLGSSFMQDGKADFGGPILQVPAGFPDVQDISVLLPRDVDTPILGDWPTVSGRHLLAEGWLNQVSDAFYPTDVRDAVEQENIYEDWQLVSVRVAPCGPLGRFPGEVPDGVCWPQVRLVWQPILANFFMQWMFVDFYAEDRAIHSLYRVHPDDSAEGFHPALKAVQAQIASEEGFAGATPEMMKAFYAARDQALLRLTRALANLRGKTPLFSSWSDLDIRAEYMEGPEEATGFHFRLADFLAHFAEPNAIHELTAFSLPEGRSPSSIDTWVFLAFEGRGDGIIHQRDITVRSEVDGRMLANLGLDQTVSTSMEDPELEEAVAADPELLAELQGQVFFTVEDEQKFAAKVADPEQTFVHTTTCATCHRLTELRFDFHTFSYFEDREATISPRVRGDVKFDLGRIRGFVQNLTGQGY